MGSLDVEALLLSDGTFAIALQQVADLFSVRPDNTQKWLKVLLGKDFQFVQTKTNRNEGSKQNRKENVLLLTDFERVILRAAIKGNEIAITLSESLIGLSLHQLWCDAFDIEFEKADRQKYLKARMEGKVVRIEDMDAIKHYIDFHDDLSDSYKHWIYKNVSDVVNMAVFGKKASVLCKERNCNSKQLRDTHDAKSLDRIRQIEEFAKRLIIKFDTEPLEATKQAIEFYKD